MTITADLEVQLGQEVTSDAWGTEVTPTVILAGVQDVEISPIVDIQQVEQMDGTQVPSRKSLVQMVGGEGSVSTLLSYDDIGYWLQGLFGVATATSDAAGGWTHNYNAPFESSDVEGVVTYTLQEGDGTNIYTLNGATVNTLNITAESGAPAEVSVDFIGKSVTTDARAALSVRSVSCIMGDHIQLFIDAGSDAFGSTATSDIGWSLDLTLEANREVKRHLNDLTPTDYRNAKMSGSLSLSLEHTAVTEAYVAAIVNATAQGVDKNVRLLAVDASSNSLTLDFAGILSGEPDIFTDVDGTVSMDLELLSQLNSGDTNWFTAVVSNGTQNLV